MYLTVVGLYEIQGFHKASALGVTACQPRVLTSVRAPPTLTIDNVRYRSLATTGRPSYELLDRKWIAATALGMASGLALGIVLLGTRTDDVTLPLRGLITGVSIGIAQFLLLRSISGRAPVWALSVALGWALDWTITRAAGSDLSQQWTVFGSPGALVFQLLTGVALSWALRQGRVAPGSQAELAA